MVTSKLFRLSIIAILLAAAPFTAMTQEEPQLPLTWEGEGVSWYLDEGDIGQIEFEMSFTIDEEGWVTGNIQTDDGSAKLKKFYYTVQEDGVRTLVVAWVAEDGENPMLFLTKGKLLETKLFIGETYVKAYDKDGKIESDLYLGSNSAMEITDEYMPTSLKSALWSCKLIGGFKVAGKIK